MRCILCGEKTKVLETRRNHVLGSPDQENKEQLLRTRVCLKDKSHKFVTQEKFVYRVRVATSKKLNPYEAAVAFKVFGDNYEESVCRVASKT